MKHHLIVFSACAVLLFLGVSCGSQKTYESLYIVHSGNIGGKFDPCGCSPPMGGMARRQTVANAVENQYENILTLDSGALLYVVNFLLPPTDKIYQFDAYATSVLADKVGFDAVNVSSFDLSNSADSLLAVDARTKFAWLSANLAWRKDGSLVFNPDKIFTRGNLKIGVFGVMSDNYLGTPLFNEPSPLMVTGINEAAKKEVSRLKKECDLVIALTYMSEDEMTDMLETVSGIDVVIFSHNNYHNPSSDHSANQPKKIGKTLVLKCPDGGRTIGVAELHIVNGKTNFTEDTSDVIYNSQEAVNTLESSAYRHYFFDLGPEVKNDPEIQKLLNEFVEARNRLKAGVGME